MDIINKIVENMLNSKKIILVVGKSQEDIFIQQRELLKYINKRSNIVVIRSKKATNIIREELRVVNVLGYDKDIRTMCENNSYRLKTDNDTLILTHLLEDGPGMLDLYIANELLDSTVMVGILGDSYEEPLEKIAIKLSKKSKMPVAVVKNLIYNQIGFIAEATDSNCRVNNVAWNKYLNEFVKKEII